MTTTECILLHILEYPNLFKMCNWEESKLLVLRQIFMTNGNGIFWQKTGNLTNSMSNKRIEILLNIIRKEKPENLINRIFGEETIMEIIVDKKDISEVKNLLSDHIFWIDRNDFNPDTVSFFMIHSDKILIEQKFKNYLRQRFRSDYPISRNPECTIYPDISKKRSIIPFYVSDEISTGYCKAYEWLYEVKQFEYDDDGNQIDEFIPTLSKDWIEELQILTKRAIKFYSNPDEYKKDYRLEYMFEQNRPEKEINEYINKQLEFLNICMDKINKELISENHISV